MTRYLVAFLAGALANWLVLIRFLSYTERNQLPASMWLVFALLCFLAGFALTWRVDARRIRICHFVIAGICVAQAVLIYFDLQKDPTNHNLLPFEFLFLCVAGAPVYLGAAVTRLLERRR